MLCVPDALELLTAVSQLLPKLPATESAAVLELVFTVKTRRFPAVTAELSRRPQTLPDAFEATANCTSAGACAPPFPTVTATAADVVLLKELSRARAVKLCEPLVAPVVSQLV